MSKFALIVGAIVCLTLGVGLAVVVQSGRVSFWEEHDALAASTNAPHGSHGSNGAHEIHEREGAIEREASGPAERDPNRLWCREHGVYEDECLICHPEIAGGAEVEDDHAGDEHAAHEGESHGTRNAVLWCNEHDFAEEDCGVCQPQLLADKPVGSGLKIRVSSDASAELAGIATGPVSGGDAATGVEVLGRVTYDRNNLAVVSPLGAGVVREVKAEVGDAVDAGDVMAVVTSPVIAEAKSAYLKVAAQANLHREAYSREKDLHAREISARQDLEKASADMKMSQSEVDHARQHLMNLGLTEQEVQRVAQSGATTSELPVRAPFAGTVIERDAVMGTAVEAGEALYRVADLSTMWMELSVPEDMLSQFQPGKPVQARFDAIPGLTFEGELSWIAYSVDEKTRMVQARATFPNTKGLLRDGMFGTVQLAGAARTAGVTVPEAAVQIIDGRPIVFARMEDGVFETRLVELGGTENGHVVVRGGLAAGEEVVLDESFVLKSEFLKGRLGAGCADH